jgi:hypothetical protein
MSGSTTVIPDDVDERLGARIAVLVERGRSGEAALAQAREMAAARAAELTVVAVAPQATVGRRCCGGHPYAFNCAVRDDVAEQLRTAAAPLMFIAHDLGVRMLVEGSDPPLEEWVAQGQFDLVLLPARRGLRARSHPAAPRLRRATDARVRVVSSPARHFGASA